MKTNPQPFGALLKSMLRKSNISTSAFSRRLNTSTSHLQNIESGRSSVGAETLASILRELELREREREELLQAAIEQSDGLKAGVEVGNWRIATQWWKMFGAKAIKDMDLNPDGPNSQFRWRPVVHEKWLIRCHFINLSLVVFLGYNGEKNRIEAAHQDNEIRTSSPIPKRATFWWQWKNGQLRPMQDNGTPILCLSQENETKIQNFTKPQH